jgi:hypothetical protein
VPQLGIWEQFLEVLGCTVNYQVVVLILFVGTLLLLFYTILKFSPLKLSNAGACAPDCTMKGFSNQLSRNIALFNCLSLTLPK